ncbi:hypothetical protein RB195_013710 [Necator americanus]
MTRITLKILVFISVAVNIYLLVLMNRGTANGTHVKKAPFSSHQEPILWSGILDFFPDLRNVARNELEPILLTTPRSVRKKLIVGIPTAEREEDYLIVTLYSLFDNLDSYYRKDIGFLVMFASNDTELIKSKTAELHMVFSEQILDGLLEIIAVPPAWYKTDVSSIPPTLNDAPNRMFWRTKQNIDFLYIMMYASQRCDYYLQLEDDVKAAPGYARVIFNYLALKNGTRWFLMDFSSMGFIGKLFSVAKLNYITYAIGLYYRFKPVDWILEDVLRSRYCRLEHGVKKCAEAISSFRINSGAPQFLHIGKVSSLKGKILKTYENSFNKGSAEGERGNPRAEVTTSMTPVKEHEAQNGYVNNVAMWFLNPQKGDYISIAFHEEVNITGVMFLSGVPPAPRDKLGPEAIVIARNDQSKTSLGQFSYNGSFVFRSNGTIATELRIEITADIKHWISIDHIIIDTVYCER